MEGSEGSPPNSLCMIRSAELFPKPAMEKEDTDLTVPFQELPGESVIYLGRTDDGVLALSNYRIFLLKNPTNSETSVPLGLIESAQARELFHLIINCKDASTVKCSFETAEQCSEWQRRIQLSVGVPESLDSLFAFSFYSWTCDGMVNTIPPSSTQNGINNVDGVGVVGGNMENTPSFICAAPEYSERLQRASLYDQDFTREVERLGYVLNRSWRISHANADFKLCPSYPQKILVPSCIPDEMLHAVANFRGSRRLPAVVWRHRKSCAVIARCSQPEVGWLGWRNAKDEQLLKALADACAFDRGEQMRGLTQSTCNQTIPSGESSPSSPDGSHEEVALDEVKKVLIVDARSYTSAVTNRARGGGCECIEYYPCAEIEFMNLGNIHAIRKSFQALRQLCASPPDVPNWLGMLEKTMWLQHLSGLLTASMTVCHAIEKQGRPVLVHCSDGWDRTPQIVATAQLCLDPFYRTVEGFRVLVEREWLSFGHKFADRCGHGPGSDELNERCPVFLQWLDLVHQIHKQFPCSFEFSMAYLIKLAQHSLSCLFGTFFCNTFKERLENTVFERTFSVWAFLSGPMYRNPLYIANKEKVLWPAHNVRDLYLWTEVYLGSLGNKNCIDFPSSNVDSLHGSMSPMAKTRSYGDLISAGIMQNGISRRSSDPNMTVDPNLTIGSNSENNSVTDLQSEREDSPDIIANMIHDTTQDIQNLTIELNHQDDEGFRSFQQKYADTSEIRNDVNSFENTLQKLHAIQQQQEKEELERGQDQQTHTMETNQNTAAFVTNGSSQPFSSPQNNAAKHLDSELHTTTTGATIAQPQSFDIANKAAENSTTLSQNGLNGLTDIEKTKSNIESSNSKSTYFGTSNITINKTSDIDLDLMQSVDLRENLYDPIMPSYTDGNTNSNMENQLVDMWHGSVNTSTDTLVPIEHKLQNDKNTTIKNGGENVTATDKASHIEDDVTDGATMKKYTNSATATTSLGDLTKNDNKLSISNTVSNTSSSTKCSILPKVHNGSGNRSNIVQMLSTTSSSNASVASSPSSSLNNLNKLDSCDININTNNKNINNSQTTTNHIIHNSASSNNSNTISELELYLNSSNATTQPTQSYNLMEESIQICVEHEKLEISASGKCETVSSGTDSTVSTQHGNNSNTTVNNSNNNNNTNTVPAAYPPSYTSYATAATQRRRRTSSSSNSRRDTVVARQVNGSTISRFSLPGVRSLPMTPPGLTERPQIAISCPDGLAHALSEQNIRLQQIVYEHKLREDELKREIHRMRMELLRKTCPNCNNVPATTDEQCSALDNVENASICSWEALEDRSGPSSCTTSSSTQPNATSVRWVPDHAVSRCTSCQTVFWIGRRKHHCRSCGQIFCADCSDFRESLPDEKLFSPVRLCGPCHHSVTTRMQQQQQNRLYNVANNLEGNFMTAQMPHVYVPTLEEHISSEPREHVATTVECSSNKTAMEKRNSTDDELATLAKTATAAAPAATTKTMEPTCKSFAAATLPQQQKNYHQQQSQCATAMNVTTKTTAAATATTKTAAIN